MAAYEDWTEYLKNWSNPAPAASPAAAAQNYVSSPTWEGFNGSTPQGGHSEGDILAAALAYGQPRGLSPVYLKDNGQFLNGGYQIKFRDNNLGGVSTTEFVPIAGFSGYQVGSSGGGGGGVPGGGGGGGNVFDPLLSQLKADLAAQGISDIASRNSATNRAIGMFGEVPDFGQAGQSLGFNLGEVVDPQTRQLAEQNTAAGTSTVARIGKANTDAVRQIKNALAARGALRSGEAGHQLGEQDLRHKQAQFDARGALLEMLSGYQRGYLEGERQRQAQYFNALMAGAGRAQYSGTGGGGGGFQSQRPPVPTQFPDMGDAEMQSFDNFANYPDALRVQTVKNYLGGGDPYDPRRIQGGPQF